MIRRTMQKEELLKYLETNADENSTIEQIVATFAKMREMPIDGVCEYARNQKPLKLEIDLGET